MKELENELIKVNKYLQHCLWMVFSYEIINSEYIKIIGSIDLSWENSHSIELFFESPINILTILSDWHKPDKKPFIELATEEEAVRQLKYIGKGHYIFKINAEGYTVAPIWIIAKSFKCNILKTNNGNNK